MKGYFSLPETCWLDNYYNPLQSRFDTFLAKHNTEEAKLIIDAETKKIKLYKNTTNITATAFISPKKDPKELFIPSFIDTATLKRTFICGE